MLKRLYVIDSVKVYIQNLSDQNQPGQKWKYQAVVSYFLFLYAHYLLLHLKVVKAARVRFDLIFRFPRLRETWQQKLEKTAFNRERGGKKRSCTSMHSSIASPEAFQHLIICFHHGIFTACLLNHLIRSMLAFRNE